MDTSVKSATTVLIVDDDPWARTTTSAILSVEGYGVREAKSGEDALRMISSERPDVVLLDLALPRQSGLEVMREIKKDRLLAQLPVVVLSAYADRLGAQDTLNAAGVLKKPYDYDALLQAVERAIKQGPAA